MRNDLIGTAIGLGLLGIGVLCRVLWVAIRDCAHDSAEFPDQSQPESDESLMPLSFPQNNEEVKQ